GWGWGPEPDVMGLATAEEEAPAALEALADAVGATRDPAVEPLERPAVPDGLIDLASFAAVVGATIPEGAIVVDEAVTGSFMLPDNTAGAPEHDWLFLTGGSIGWGP